MAVRSKVEGRRSIWQPPPFVPWFRWHIISEACERVMPTMGETYWPVGLGIRSECFLSACQCIKLLVSVTLSLFSSQEKQLALV